MRSQSHAGSFHRHAVPSLPEGGFHGNSFSLPFCTFSPIRIAKVCTRVTIPQSPFGASALCTREPFCGCLRWLDCFADWLAMTKRVTCICYSSAGVCWSSVTASPITVMYISTLSVPPITGSKQSGSLPSR